MAKQLTRILANHLPTCSRCGMSGAVVIVPADNKFYCLPCLKLYVPLLYSQLSNWVRDHPPKKA